MSKVYFKKVSFEKSPCYLMKDLLTAMATMDLKKDGGNNDAVDCLVVFSTDDR